MKWTQDTTYYGEINTIKPQQNKMTKQVKDTVEVAIANGGALGLTLTQVNDWLQFISLSLAIIFTIYKFIKKDK